MSGKYGVLHKCSLCLQLPPVAAEWLVEFASCDLANCVYVWVSIVCLLHCALVYVSGEETGIILSEVERPNLGRIRKSWSELASCSTSAG